MPINPQGPISFNGLESGYNTAGMIKAMVAAAHRPIDTLQAQQGYLTAHADIYNQVIGQLQTLQADLQAMDSPQTFGQLSAGSSDEAVISAAAGTGAQAGSYAVQVQSLASAQRTYTYDVASANTPGLLGSGSITLQMGNGTAATVQVDNTTTLQSLADSINGSGAGITATVINDAGGARLAINGSATGSANAITFTENGTNLGLNDPNNTPEQASDAQVLLDNTSTITSSTNTINGAIPGVTLVVHQQSTASQTVSVGLNPTATQAAVQKVVDDYNTVMTTINGAINFKRGDDGKPVVDPSRLVGDSTLQSLVRDLQSSISESLTGTGSNYTTLGQVGIRTQKDGTLAFNTADFNNAFTNDPTGVSRLFTRDSSTNTQGLAPQMEQTITSYTTMANGMLTTLTQSISGQVKTIGQQIELMQSSVDAYEDNLQQQFNQLETTLAKLKTQGNYIEQFTKSLHKA